MNHLVIAVTSGRGGKEFAREATSFADYWRLRGDYVKVVRLPAEAQWVLRKMVLRALKDYDGKIDRLSFFCHGRTRWLRVGFHRWNVMELATAIKRKCSAKLDVALYACSTGRGTSEWPWQLSERSWSTMHVPGSAGWAAMFTEALAVCGVDVRVFAHGPWGHTTRNPYCYRFETVGGVVTRTPIVKRGGVPWKAWIAKLKTEYRFEVPFDGR